MSEINSNGLDLSPERVEREWQRIEQEFKIFPEEVVVDSGSDEADGGEYVEVVLSAEDFARKKKITCDLIASGLNAALWMLGVSELPDHLKEDFCNSWAEVIVRRFPDNPVTDFMDAYGDLIAAGSATLILIGAVRQQKNINKVEVQKTVKSAMTDVVEEYGEAA